MFRHLGSNWKWQTVPVTKFRPMLVAPSKTFTLIIAVLILASLSPMIIHPGTVHADTDCSPNGVALSSSSWLSGGGVNVCNHPGDGSHYCLAVAGAPGDAHCPAGYVWSGDKWQCVELVNRLYLTKGWTKATWYGNGNSLINNLPNGLTKQNNGSISYVNSGDVITLNYGAYGHAGIIDTIDSNGTIHIINQNATLKSSAYIDSGSLSTGNAHYKMNAWKGYSVQAIVHHPGSQSTISKIAALQYNSEMDVYKLGSNNDIWKDTWQPSNNSWSGWVDMTGVSFTSDPVAIQYNAEMDVFAINSSGQLYKDTWQPGSNSWSGWNQLNSGVTLTGTPSAVQYNSSEMDVYARGTNNQVYKNTWNGTAWSGWNSLGGSIAGNPKVMIYGGSEMDVWARGTDGALWKDGWNGSSWGGFSSMGGSIVGDPVAIQYNSEMDVYANTPGGELFKQTWNGSSWSGWVGMPGVTFAGSPAALQYNTEMDVYARGANDSYIYKDTWQPSTNTWSGWNSLGGNEAGDPTAIKYSTEMDVYATNYAKNTDKDTWLPANNKWSGFTALL